MSEKGVIFNIQENTVHDGPGVRVTAFFKGCPLRCVWCHNPEGLSAEPEIMKNHSMCTGCGKCRAARGHGECGHGEYGHGKCGHGECGAFDVCAKVCPRGLIKVAGEAITARDLADRLKKYERIFRATGGGVTLSGGEPLAQPDFMLELITRLKRANTHVVLQTSGYGGAAHFENAAGLCDIVMFDIKQMSDTLHRKFTGRGNALILKNLNALIESGKRFIARMPMIPGANITEDHFQAAARALLPAKDRVEIQLMPYNPFGGAKYASVGRVYEYSEAIGASENEATAGNISDDALAGYPYPVRILDSAGFKWKIL